GQAFVPVVVILDEPDKLFDDLRPLGARSDKVHLAPDDVQDLGQFVQMRPAEEAADRRDTTVLLARPDGAAQVLGVLAHRAELVDREDTAVEAHPALAIEARAGRSKA